MYLYLAFLTLIKAFNPYLIKHSLDILESHELLYIDSILIFTMILFILFYKYFFNKKEIKKTFDNVQKLSFTQKICLFTGAFLSIIASTCIYELDKNHNNPFINHTITKIASMILLLLISTIFLKEKYSTRKLIGAILSILGVVLLLL